MPLRRSIPLLILTGCLGCTPPVVPAEISNLPLQGMAWTNQQTLYVSVWRPGHFQTYRWQGDTGPAIVPALVDTKPISGRDGDLLVQNLTGGKYSVYSPPQGQVTTLPLDPQKVRALGWDSEGRMILDVDDRTCGRSVQAVATGSDSGAVLVTGQYNVTLAPSRDALAWKNSGVTIFPLSPSRPGGYVANVSNYSWQGRRGLLVSASQGGWWSVDLGTGARQPVTGVLEQHYCLSPDGSKSAALSSQGIVIRDTTTERVLKTILPDDLPSP